MKFNMQQQVRGWVLALSVFALAGATPCAMAQAVFGQILGTVTDATGAAIPGAAITVTDIAKGTSVTLTSNSAGEFTVEHLIPDVYNVKVAAQGFKAYEQTSLQVFADTAPKVTAVLTIGASDQTVEVKADDVPQLKTDKTDVATIFNAQEVEELPIPDHNITNLQLLLPGAVQLGWAHAASENPQGSKQIEVDGQAFGGVNYTLDGTDNQDPILGIIVINPNYESLSEVKVATQNYDAEFGKAVSSVQTYQTKSGTNQFHGTVFDNRESNANLARDPFSVSKAQGYPGGLRNQFGGSIGGPIWKDHIFAFADYQGVRQKVGGSGVGSIPTLLALQSCTGAVAASNGQPGCDFSQYLGGAASATNGIQQHQIFDNSTGTPVAFANNIIPLSKVSPQALNLFKLLLASGKLPTSSALDSNYAGTGKGLFNSNEWDVRGDANLNQSIHVFGRFSRFTDILSGGSLFGSAGGPGLGIAGFGGTSLGANDSLALGTDIAVNARLVTDVRLGYYRYNIGTSKNDPSNTNLPFLGQNVSGTGAGLTVGQDFGTPDIDIADATQTKATDGPANGQNAGAQFGSGLNMNHCNCPLKEKEDQFQIVNNWTKTLGPHSIKVGADIRYARNLRVPSDQDRTGHDQFGNGPTSDGTNPTGLGFATFILGDVSAFNRYTSVSTNAKEFQPRDFFYAQDTWRATPQLTLNAGLRYEFYAPERVNGPGNGALLNLATGYINVAGKGGIPLNMGVAAAKNTYNPRLGVAYQFNPKTVIRAGYGRSFDLGVFGSEFGHVVTQNIPVLANQSINATGGTTSYAFNLSDPTNTTIPGEPVHTNADSPLTAFTPPATNTQGQISIQAVVPGTGGQTIGQSVNVKARPFTSRLPTLDAWNLSVQRSLTPTISVEVAYVGNKGTHTLSDGAGNNTNPNEPAISLPGSYRQDGIALHYDPAAGNGVVNGATANSTLLRRFNNGSLPACTGACQWTQDISYYGDDQDSHYNAIQAKVTKAYAQGLSINLNYAYQVAKAAGNGFATWDKQAVIGNASDVRRSAFTAYGLYKLPFGHNQMFLNGNNAIINYLVGGFEFSPTVSWQSGLPYSLSYSECGATLPGDAPCQPSGSTSSLRKTYTGFPGGGSSSTGADNTLRAFVPLTNICNGGTSFSCAPLDQIGTIRRNTQFGPNFFNSDMSISKNFTIRERYSAQLRMDAYNAFNHINYGNPNGNIDSGDAGKITGGPYPAGIGGTTNPRQLQFTAHLQF